MDHLPIYFDVKGRKVIVTGGGTLAARRADLALRAGARVAVFAQRLEDDFRDLAGNERLTHIAGEVTPAAFEDCVLAYGATEDEASDKKLHDLAKRARVPVNVADTVKFCDFIMPAILDRSPLVISISSGGAAPILVRILRARLETMFPARFGQLAGFAGRFRETVMKRLSDGVRRRRFWEEVLDGPVADMFLAGDESGAQADMELALDDAVNQARHEPAGEVYLVGAGPGDPDLLTFRALRLMQRADVVVYDRLIGDRILNLVRRDAERIYVGKLPRDHTLPQEEISQLLVRLAREGKRVLRLKGGDPFIFGRGGEEIETLASEGISFQVVPGITAASGCAAYAGIPLTHRDHAQTCIFVTGHGKDGMLDLDWATLLQPRQTVAVYMGLSQIGALSEEFIARGADPAMPAAIIDKGTRDGQKVVTGTLETLRRKAAAAGLSGPALIVIGTVVTLHDKLAWFNAKRREKTAVPAA